MQPTSFVLPTRYKGILFRSRTEARWAVFFDTLGLRWQYEAEGYKVPIIASGLLSDEDPEEEQIVRRVWYLPDFYLPDIELFIEVKPAIPWGGWPTDDILDRARGLQIVTKHSVCVLCGTPGPIQDAYSELNPYQGFTPGDHCYYWCECPFCGALGIQFEGRSGRNKHTADCARPDKTWDKYYNTDSPRLLDAYAAATNERFGR